MFRLAAALLIVATGQAATADPAAEAFRERDFARALELSRVAAAEGSAEAMLRLGTIHDLGLGTAPDPAKALRWYLRAAEAGLPEAQFNVAILLDAGAGRPRDTVAAAAWYGRAAAGGLARAQYNLALLYLSGEGVPRNTAVARYWLDRAAAELPAAANRLRSAPPAETGPLQAPDLTLARRVAQGDTARAVLVWSAPPGPAGAEFMIELRLADADGRTRILRQTSAASAATLPLPDGSGPAIARILQVDRAAARYAASRWLTLGTGRLGTAGPGDGASVVLRHGAQDSAAARLATDAAATFRNAGLPVRIEATATPPATTTVRHAFDEDATVAAQIAAFLPVLSDRDVTRLSTDDGLPGEIRVDLSGGPTETAAQQP